MAFAHQGLDDGGADLCDLADRAGFLALEDLDQVVAVFGADRFGDVVERHFSARRPQRGFVGLGEVAQVAAPVAGIDVARVLAGHLGEVLTSLKRLASGVGVAMAGEQDVAGFDLGAGPLELILVRIVVAADIALVEIQLLAGEFGARVAYCLPKSELREIRLYRRFMYIVPRPSKLLW